MSRTKSRKFSVSLIIGLLLICFFAVTFSSHFVRGGGVWWDTNWQYRKSITIDHTKVSANFTNFPVLIKITDSSLSSHAQSSGNDIAFADYSGNKLNHEIELYDSSTGYLVAWVNVASLSSSTDTILYMYYGNPSAVNQQNVSGTWDSNYVMVQHLAQASGNFIDSTGNHNSCTPSGTLSYNVTGQIDGAAGFDGSTSYATIPFGLSPPYTIECWANPATLKQDNAIISFQLTKDASGSGVSMGIYNTGNQIVVGNYAFQKGLSGVSTYLTAGTWSYWCDAVTAGNNIAFYLNGAAPTLTTISNWYDNDANYRVIGARHSTSYSRFWNGTIDEVRISNIVRTASWISTEYNNQQSPSSFYTVGSEETYSTVTMSNLSPPNGVTRVPISLSMLNFSLANGPNDAMNYYVTTTPNIGSGSGTGVHNGAYSVSVSGLQLNTTYTWQVNATDPSYGTWNNQTFSFKTIEFYGNWWDANWPYRKSITVDHTKVGGSVTDFTVLIDITDTDLASKVQSNGNDIAFTDYAGNKLNHEIEFFNSATGGLVAWVKVPSLSSVSDTLLYMYYGNPSAVNQQNVSGTWDSNYVMVQHLAQASGNFIDSTGNHNDCTPNGISHSVAGRIDGAAAFDGSSSYATIPFGLSPPYTIECWANPATLSQDGAIIAFEGTEAGGSGVSMGIYNNESKIVIGNDAYRYGLGTPNAYLTAGTWAYWCDAVTTASSINFYLNGAAQTLSSIGSYFSNNPNYRAIGARYNSGYGHFWNGTIDEVRISNIVRTASWISTEYNNQQSPSSFYTVASEETFSLKFPSISNPSPAIGATVGPSLSELSFDLTDYLNDSMNYYVTTSPDIGSGSGTGVYAGAYSLGVSGLQLNTTYTWHVSAIDPLFGIWNNQTFSFKTISELEVTSASPATVLTLDRGSQRTFQISWIMSADTTWYINGLQQHVDYNLQTASWNCTFNNLGVFNVTASGYVSGLTGKYEWSVEVVINFTGSVADRVRTDFVASQPWEKGWVYDECIWYDRDFQTYFMIYNGAPIGQRQAGFAWSSNGLNWTKYAGNPVLSVVPSSWEGGELCWTTTHIKINGTYWIYYQAGSGVGLVFIDIAPDGSGGYTVGNVTRYSGNPVISGGTNPEFSCTRINSTFWIGYIGPTSVSCLTSPDGLTWTYLQKNILVPEGHGWDSSLLTPLYTYIYGGSVYLTLTGNYKEDGVAYCRVGDWTNLAFSPYNPILPIGAPGTWEGGEAGGLSFTVDENGHVIVNSDNTLDCWYVGVQSLGGTGDSGFGHGRIYNINGGPPYHPQLQMSQDTITCRKYGEHFTVQVNVTNAIAVESFNFAIFYNPTLVSYVSVTWGELGSGTITRVDPVNGILDGHVVGTSVSGNRWLLNITFQDIATMIWKQGQVNELDGQIWFHNASLNSEVQQLVYQESGLGQISVSNVTFNFMPIQGDLDNNGVVDISDLRTVAAYYDVKQGDPLWSSASAYDLNGNGVIDIYDLVLIGANFN